jgi:hypothetical protein
MARRLLPSILVFFAILSGCGAILGEDAASDEQNLSAEEANLARLKRAAANVEQPIVKLDDAIVAPSTSPESGTKLDQASLSGIDWYQKWAGGRVSDHVWSRGSEFGKRCMWVSLARFEAIMKEPPPELLELLAAAPQWKGTFENWNDDYGGKSSDGRAAFGDAKEARLWAWRPGVAKWISATSRDGRCFLPTRSMVISFARTCREQLASNGGDMQGCEARSR